MKSNDGAKGAETFSMNMKPSYTRRINSGRDVENSRGKLLVEIKRLWGANYRFNL